MSLYARLTRSRPVARTRVMPPPEPEWERIAEEITAARAQEPLTFRHCIPCCGRAEAAT